jgi:hypothetical protein
VAHDIVVGDRARQAQALDTQDAGSRLAFN